jgi:DNA-binding PadR family transcriptional regulator
MVVLERKEEDGKEMKRQNSAETQRALGSAGRPRKIARASRELALTTPDLVLLSLLAERPMHGYQANLELERREIRDWANVSRPQVYYSLEKLTKGRLLRSLEAENSTEGPERSPYETTEKGREALEDALEHEGWTTQRDHPPFLTWMALSWQARPGVFRSQLKRRRKFLLKEIAREKKTLLSIYAEVGHKYHEAVWMVSLMIAQMRAEVLWSKRLERDLERRARALSPQFAEGLPK